MSGYQGLGHGSANATIHTGQTANLTVSTLAARSEQPAAMKAMQKASSRAAPTAPTRESALTSPLR